MSNNALDSEIEVGPTFINVGFFFRPYYLIKEGESTFFAICKYLFKALHLFFLQNFPGSMFRPCTTSFPESRVELKFLGNLHSLSIRSH